MRPAVRVARSALLVLLLVARGARATEPCAPRGLAVEGARRTRVGVIEELLPRPPPDCYSADEISELERRLWGLEIFDDVAVEAREAELVVRLREKWTLIPNVELSAGTSLKDSFAQVSVTESNFLGRAQKLALLGYYAQRNFGGEIVWGEHENAARRFTLEASGGYSGSDVFFEKSASAWTYTSAYLFLGMRTPFSYGRHWQLAFFAMGYHERSEGDIPQGLARDGGVLGAQFKPSWDVYEWHDVAPRGVKWTTTLQGAGFGGDGRLRNRSGMSSQGVFAIRMNENVALMINAVVEAVVPGHPNHSYIFGNLRGVRALPDNLYRTAAQAFTNIEWRFAARLASRWYLQGAALLDAGTYAPMNERGKVEPFTGAISTGVGLRVIPTFLSGVVPRLDVGKVLFPSEYWYGTFGLAQYFGG